MGCCIESENYNNASWCTTIMIHRDTVNERDFLEKIIKNIKVSAGDAGDGSQLTLNCEKFIFSYPGHK